MKTELLDIAEKLTGWSSDDYGFEIVKAEQTEGGAWVLTVKKYSKTEGAANESDQ